MLIKDIESKVQPFKINLQLFAEDEGTEDVENFDDEDYSESENNEDGEAVDTADEEDDEEEVEDTGESEEEAEVAEPQDDKMNTAFAKMRRENEEYKRQLETERIARDKWVEQNFGSQYGVKTWNEYQLAMEKQIQKQQEQQWIEQGYDPKMIKEIMKSDPQYQQAVNFMDQQKQAKQQEAENARLSSEFDELKNAYPDSIKEPEDIDQKTWELSAKGYSLSDAYLVAHKDEVLGKTKAATKQRTLNNINSKKHIKGDKGSNNVDDISVPADVVESYKAMCPGITMAQIKKDYKEFIS